MSVKIAFVQFAYVLPLALTVQVCCAQNALANGGTTSVPTGPIGPTTVTTAHHTVMPTATSPTIQTGTVVHISHYVPHNSSSAWTPGQAPTHTGTTAGFVPHTASVQGNGWHAGNFKSHHADINVQHGFTPSIAGGQQSRYLHLPTPTKLYLPSSGNRFATTANHDRDHHTDGLRFDSHHDHDFQSGRNSISEGRHDIRTGFRDIQEGRQDLRQARSLYTDGRADLGQGRTDIKEGYGDIRLGQARIAEGTRDEAQATRLSTEGNHDLMRSQSLTTDANHDLLAGQQLIQQGNVKAGDKMLAEGQRDLNQANLLSTDGTSDLSKSQTLAQDGSRDISSGQGLVKEGRHDIFAGRQLVHDGRGDLRQANVLRTDGKADIQQGHALITEGSHDIRQADSHTINGNPSMTLGNTIVPPSGGQINTGTQTTGDVTSP